MSHCLGDPTRGMTVISIQRAGWVERPRPPKLQRATASAEARRAKEEGGSDTHQLLLMALMGFAKGLAHPTCYGIEISCLFRLLAIHPPIPWMGAVMEPQSGAI